MGKIENHKYTIEEAFRECFYIVPDYQREYVWKENEVFKLLEDIDEEFESGTSQEDFIGTVLVSPAANKGHYEVIDGQQRLTTFFLLLCALRHRFKDTQQEATIESLLTARFTTKGGKTQTSLKLEPRYEGGLEQVAKIEEVNADPDETLQSLRDAGIKMYGALENIFNAYKYIYEYLSTNYRDVEELEKYWGYLANSVVFIQISTELSSALKIFETINERGVGLNPMDLLKNLLFTQVSAKDFGKLRDQWKLITKPLEKREEKPLRFLRYFIMANYVVSNDRGDGIVREDEIYDWFTKKENKELCGYEKDPFGFVRKIVQNVDCYLNFAMGKGNDGYESQAMDNLRKLCGGSFSLHHILLLAASNLPKDLFDHFVKQLESFLFFYIFTKTPTKELERNFTAWADTLREISSIAKRDVQVKKLNQFLQDRFDKSIKAKTVQLSDDLRRFTITSMQRYRTRYLLAKITQYVDMAFKGVRQPGSLGEYMDLEIEHILPDTPEKDLLKSFHEGNQGKDYQEYKNRLGNLTLLEKPINIVAGNSFFADKKKEYKKSKNYLTSSIVELTIVGKDTSTNRINKKLQSFDQWDASSIDRRQSMLQELVTEIWTISEFE